MIGAQVLALALPILGSLVSLLYGANRYMVSATGLIILILGLVFPQR